MKRRLTRRQLRRLILRETRDMHVQGIRNKIARLQAELERQQAALARVDVDADEASRMTGDPYDAMEVQSMHGDPIRTNIWGVEDKRDFLQSQLDAFDEAGDDLSVDLPRRD